MNEVLEHSRYLIGVKPALSEHLQGSFDSLPSVSWQEARMLENQAALYCSAECLLLAQSGHFAAEFRCPLLGVKRTLVGDAAMSAFDPKRTSAKAHTDSLKCASLTGRIYVVPDLRTPFRAKGS